MNDETLTLDPDRCALIIQDLQNDVMIEGGALAAAALKRRASLEVRAELRRLRLYSAWRCKYDNFAAIAPQRDLPFRYGCLLRALSVQAFAVVLADGREDVEDERAVRAAVGRVLDTAREDVGLERPQLVRHAFHDEGLHPLEHDPELLVRMAVERDDSTGLEADEVQHRSLAEERLPADSGGELERAQRVQTHELRRHALDYCWIA
jgi:hypothetical protein